MPTPPALTFATLLYRYWFFGWMFRDASRGNALERVAALRHNAERARWLPTYIRRWALLAVLTYGAGTALEGLGLHGVAPLAFVPVCVAASVLAIASAAWCLLRRPSSAYTSRSGGDGNDRR